MEAEKNKETKRGRKKGSAKKLTSMNSIMKAFQKEYEKLLKSKKEIDRKIKILEKSSTELGFKLTKRLGKSTEESEIKPKKKSGRKKKETTVPEVNSPQS